MLPISSAFREGRIARCLKRQGTWSAGHRCVDGKVARVQLSRCFPGTPTITLELALACLLLLTSRSRSGVWPLEDKYTESENSFFMPS